MVKIITYPVKAFILSGSDAKIMSLPGADYLRTAFLLIIDRFQKKLKDADVDMTVFHNHDEHSGMPIIRYPLVIYSHKDGEFFISGINEGAVALKAVMDLLFYPVQTSRELVLTFHTPTSTDFEISNCREKKIYRITDWLPFLMEEYGEMELLNAGKIIKIFEDKLRKHIINDVGKYLDIDLGKTKVEILTFPHSSIPYISFSHKRKFKPFSFHFSTNTDLPDLLGLGYEKAIGFGRIEKITAE